MPDCKYCGKWLGDEPKDDVKDMMECNEFIDDNENDGDDEE
jgi:hypothetical protein